MIKPLHAALIALSAAILTLFLLLIILKRHCFPRKTRTRLSDPGAEAGRGNHPLQNGSAAARLHQVSPAHPIKENAADNSNAFFKKSATNNRKQGSSFFSWADHPSLVAEAVENGWSRFGFAALDASSSSSGNKSMAMILAPPCVAGDDRQLSGNESSVEITWEVFEGSSDYMQKVRFRPNVKKPSSVIVRAGLPLPGPYLGSSSSSSSFPQEAYFEITVLSLSGLYDRSSSDELKILGQEESNYKSEGDRVKLIEDDFNKKTSGDSSSVITSSHSQRKNSKIIMDDLKKRGKLLLQDEGRVLVSVGLTCGGGNNSQALKILPGNHQGSIGFNSSGSVYVNGTKLLIESEAKEWSAKDKVIGCGYNPSQRRVFFTVDSQLVQEIHCKTDEFTSPLYPILASNVDAVILVNLGQSPFKYLPANSQRTPNPCFVMMNSSPSLGFIEDSKELFSMERIDSQGLLRSSGLVRSSNNNTVNSVRSLEYDVESEGDLFEIVLDHSSSTVRSPYAYSSTTYNH